MIKIFENADKKILKSEAYNFVFDKKTGYFARWGKTKDEDPQFGMPEIADIEITTKCTGPGGKLCKFCYKNNTPMGDNMSIDTFEKVLNKLHHKFVKVELDNGDIIILNESDCIDTKRGTIKVSELLSSDEII